MYWLVWMVPRLGPKTDSRGAQKNNSHNILQDVPADRASRQLRHSFRFCAPLRSAKSLVGDSNLSSFEPLFACVCYFNVEEEFSFFFVAAIYRINWRERSTFDRLFDLDEVTKMADKADSRAPFHLILEGLRCTSPRSSLDSTRRSSSHPHTST